jgi:hypothetical protein
MTDKTELQQAIEDAIKAHPELDDKAIAKVVWLQSHPTESYGKGCSPSHQYVGKIRGRLQFQSQAPEVNVEPPEETEEPKLEEGEEEEEQPFNPEAFPTPAEEPEEQGLPSGEGFTSEDGEFLIEFTFDKLAEVTGYPGWALDPQNKSDKRFKALGSKILDKYVFPNLEKYALEVMFCYTGLMTVAPRIGGYRKFRETQKPLVNKIEEQAPPPQEEEPIQPKEDKPPSTLQPGQKANGESELMRRLGR